jgi:UDP-GlcNAc3NAcA epimerase
MKKILTVVGARPQFIKASVVSRVIGEGPGLSEVLVHTGQHFDANMSDVFFAELNMPTPDYFLNINSGGHGAMTGRMLVEIERVLSVEKPDLVLVYGDTNSTLAGALAAVKLNVPIAHVEAGLRSFNLAMPEEVNRILVDRISQWLFAPTQAAVSNLVREGTLQSRTHLVGDVMYDVVLHYGAQITAEAGPLSVLGVPPKGYMLSTIHRAENTDNLGRLSVIVDSLIAMGRHLPVVVPLHPRTRAALIKLGRLDELQSLTRLIPPVSYFGMLQLEKFAELIATDSGGVQKEAFFFKVPCVTLRGETEWTELIDSGWNRLALCTDANELEATFLEARGSEGQPVMPFGVGDASQRIVRCLVQ